MSLILRIGFARFQKFIPIHATLTLNFFQVFNQINLLNEVLRFVYRVNTDRRREKRDFINSFRIPLLQFKFEKKMKIQWIPVGRRKSGSLLTGQMEHIIANIIVDEWKINAMRLSSQIVVSFSFHLFFFLSWLPFHLASSHGLVVIHSIRAESLCRNVIRYYSLPLNTELGLREVRARTEICLSTALKNNCCQNGRGWCVCTVRRSAHHMLCLDRTIRAPNIRNEMLHYHD